MPFRRKSIAQTHPFLTRAWINAGLPGATAFGATITLGPGTRASAGTAATETTIADNSTTPANTIRQALMLCAFYGNP